MEKKVVEKVVIEMWEDIFGHRNINEESDFFSLGGNSLTAIKFLAGVERVFGENSLSPDTLFITPTVKDVSSAINAAVNG